ncbi:MAG TPA: NUDIX domain-containing protein [Deinococcales bacterium]|nr:NUDIX domain-containing protein [Deinococcales bacterium]
MDEYTRFLRDRLGHAPIIRPAASILALDERGRVLLQRRSDNGLWSITGGYLNPGEDLVSCALRELLEETGWRGGITGLFGLYTEPATQQVTYANGDVAHAVVTVFLGRALERVGEPDAETLEARFFAPHDIPPDLYLPSVPVLDDFRRGERAPVLR